MIAHIEITVMACDGDCDAYEGDNDLGDHCHDSSPSLCTRCRSCKPTG